MSAEFSLLIGGKAGDGIDTAGLLLGRLLSQAGRYVYIYRDYPSLIRGGHTFSLIRSSNVPVASHRNQVDCILALTQDTLTQHTPRLKPGGFILYDRDVVKADAIAATIKSAGVGLETIIKEENAPAVMRNSCMIGAFAKASGISWEALEAGLKKYVGRQTEQNIAISRRGYAAVPQFGTLEPAGCQLPLLTGSEAMGLGLIKAGLESYFAYPMTPSSPLLHFLAGVADEVGLQVVHPESEIAVMLMATGAAYAGRRVAVGTSGGGFCLMTEGFSLAGMAEIPVVVMLGQRPGPSTGLPTYTSQTELHFALHAGHGEFTRLVVAPGDAQEAYYWSAKALNLAWKYQLPALILTDKTLAEGVFNFDPQAMPAVGREEALWWDKQGSYKRYLDTANGVSPLASVPEAGAVVKVNSYEHDQYGITSEDPTVATAMQEKRLRKEQHLRAELSALQPVRVYGDPKASRALVCWGTNKAVCAEVAALTGCRVIQPVVLWPFPVAQFQEALTGVRQLITVENNATGQLGILLRQHGLSTDTGLYKYDGRPFTVDELEERLAKVRA